MSQYTDLARGILERNDKGGYTVPTARLYPFQWNWDSAFVSMGFATFNVERAYRELERLVEGKLVRPWNKYGQNNEYLIRFFRHGTLSRY